MLIRLTHVGKRYLVFTHKGKTKVMKRGNLNKINLPLQTFHTKETITFNDFVDSIVTNLRKKYGLDTISKKDLNALKDKFNR